MKKLFTILAVAATLVSCAKEDVVREAEGEAIQFGNAFVENSTRANDPSYSKNDIASFKVYGTVEGQNIFAGANVTKTADYGKAWSCDGATQYWIAGADYIFDAVVDATAITTDTTTGLPTVLNYKVATQKDMLYDRVETTGKPVDNDGLVAFEFTHLLSKINFTVTNTTFGDSATNYSFVVRNIKFNGAVEGNYKVSTGWDSDNFVDGVVEVGNGNDKVITVATAAAAQTVADLNTEVLLLPDTYTISFTVDILYNGKLLTTTNYPATDSDPSYTRALAANNAYNFNIEVSLGDPIKFTVEKKPEWTPTTDVTLQ